MGRARTRGWAAWALVMLIVAASGCSTADSRSLEEWTLRAEGVADRPIALPARFGDELAARGGRYQLTTEIALAADERGRALSLSIPMWMAPVELQANGVRIAAVDRDGASRADTSGAHHWRIPAELTAGDRLRLTLSVEDDWYQATWIDPAPRLSAGDPPPRFRAVTGFNRASSAAASFVAPLIGLAYLTIFLGDRRRRSYGWIAAQALTATFYPLLFYGALYPLVGAWDGPLAVAFVTIAPLVSIGYTHQQFSLGPMPRIVWPLLGAAPIAFAISGRFDMPWCSVPLAVCALVGTFLYQSWVHVRLVRRPEPVLNAWLGLIAWSFISLCAGLDVVAWLGWGELLAGARAAPLGILAFVVIQTTALSREHLLANRELEHRVTLLEQRDREKEQLTEELRRQVSQRSRQLSHALARLAVAPDAVSLPEPGDVIDERYRIEDTLGAGAMGSVYRVRRLDDDAELAMKVLRPVSDAALLARFAREAHIAAEISHANVVRIHDIDFASSGFMYVVMDLVRGASLRAYLRDGEPIERPLAVLAQIAEGLAALHAGGVVHRDLKPDNVLLELVGDEPRVRVTDFGVSGIVAGEARTALLSKVGSEGSDATALTERVVAPPPAYATTRSIVRADADSDSEADSDAAITRADSILGTPAYVAPECCDRGRDSSQRDIFSLGVIAFELLAGARPYDRPPMFAILRQEPLPTVRSLAEARPDLPARISRAIDRALSFEPADRPTARELADLFRTAAT